MADEEAKEFETFDENEQSEEKTESVREPSVLPKDDDEEVTGADAPIETNKPTRIDPKYDLADRDAEVDPDDDDYVVDPISGGRLSKDSPFNPFRGI